MRYIADSNGYLLYVSFGADIKCDGDECTEYTGTVPDGYESLDEWYSEESEKIYMWKIVSGNLTADSSADVPADIPTMVDRIIEQGEKNGWTYRIWANGDQECWYSGETGSLDTSSFNAHSGFYYVGIGLTFPFTFSAPPTVVVDGGSHDILNFLRIAHVSETKATIWALGLENIDTDTIIYYHAYAKGKAAATKAAETNAVLGTNALGLMRLGEGG